MVQRKTLNLILEKYDLRLIRDPSFLTVSKEYKKDVILRILGMRTTKYIIQIIFPSISTVKIIYYKRINYL